MRIVSEFFSKVVGNTFCTNGQAILRGLKKDEILQYKREPDNKYDANAIALLTSKNERIGFIPGETVQGLAPQVDAGCTLSIKVSEITGLDKKNQGCNIHITVLSDKEEDSVDSAFDEPVDGDPEFYKY